MHASIHPHVGSSFTVLKIKCYYSFYCNDLFFRPFYFMIPFKTLIQKEELPFVLFPFTFVYFLVLKKNQCFEVACWLNDRPILTFN